MNSPHSKRKNIYLYSMILSISIAILSPCQNIRAEGNRPLRENAVVKAVRKVTSAVVNINTEYELKDHFSGFETDPLFESFFRDFLDPGFHRRYKRTSLGSGVIIDGRRGFILTNAHVIEKMGNISVILKDERQFSAQIVGADPDSDLAVLRVKSKEALPEIEMGNSDDIMIGETVIAIGNPFGFSNTVTTGVVSALNRSIRTEDMTYHNFIQTDASINPGNSGGPLLNINGELIGINTAIYAKAQGIGFAIPINRAEKIISDLIQYGEVVHAWVGITVQELDDRISQYLDIPDTGGVMVKEIFPSGPAYKAGIREGDIIVSLNGRKIESLKDYQTLLKGCSSGDTIKLGLWRNKRKEFVEVLAQTFPTALAMDLADKLLGISVENLSGKAGADQGVVITKIRRRSYLARIGVRTGDIIRQLDEVSINSVDDFKKAIIKYRHKASLVVLLQRGRYLYNFVVKL